MIFLRQKNYNNSRQANRHRNHRHHSHNRSQTTQFSNRVNNTNGNRINTNNNNYINTNTNTNSSIIEPRSIVLNHSNSTTSIDLIRSITINERLASIGGLFGALSIIITGALLYAIFTAKSQDKWYYIIAVLINVSLLIILMIAAILFDRLYLKKHTPRTPISNENSSRQANNRIININPSFYANRQNFITQQNVMPNLNEVSNPNENVINSLEFLNVRIYNDIPPEYPGYLDSNDNSNSNTYLTSSIINENSVINNANNSNKTSNNVQSQTINTISSQMIINSNQNNQTLPTFCATNGQNLNNYNYLTQKDNNNNTNTNNSGQSLPPNYFDLYPNNLNNCMSMLNSLPNDYNQRIASNEAENSNKNTILHIEQ